MATMTGTARKPLQLLKDIVAFLIDSGNFGAGNPWQLLRPATVDAIIDEVILKGVGDGHDSIFVGMKLQKGADEGQIDLLLNGFAGFDANLDWREQPGAIPHKKLPILPLVEDVFTTYWLTANTSRFIIVTEMSTQYECCYLGFATPVAISRQYPYPLLIGGSYVEGSRWTSYTDGHSAFTHPGSDTYGGLGGYRDLPTYTPNDGDTTLRMRRPDGTWRAALNKTPFEFLGVWPTNVKPANTLTVYDQVLTIENVIQYPFLLHEMHPNGIVAQMDGVRWVGNREDLAAKDNIVLNDKVYKVFYNVFRRENDQYFAIEWS
ncbi:MAG: hypothetical protein E6713_07675 [Sporomusaceae bacterium]|nr:hypothetical protein [Sporomusaceae bacterium]